MSSQQVGPNNCSKIEGDRKRGREREREEGKKGRERIDSKGRGNPHVLTEPLGNNNRMLLLALTSVIVLHTVG